jgi:hypothetical protein
LNIPSKEEQMFKAFFIIPNFLRDPKSFYQSIQRGENLKSLVFQLSISAVSFLAIFGFVLGLSDEWLQALSTAVKMPLLFAATGLFCLPALYFFSLALLGTPLRMMQVSAVVLCSFGVTAFLLLGLAPVTFFFVLTADNYGFFQLLAVVFVAISGGIGLYFLWNGMTFVEPAREGAMKSLGRIILGGWLFLYAFVSAQMTWRLSPFIGDPQKPFVLLMPSRDNFYIDVLHAVQRATGATPETGWNGASLVGILLGLICLGGIAACVFAVGMAVGRNRHPRPAPADPS